MYDIIVIGAGPAGLSAAIYGLRAGKTALVLEGRIYGGQIINTPEINNYPGFKKISGAQLANELYQQARGLGAEIRMEKALSIEYDENSSTHPKVSVNTSKGRYEASTLILALGAKNRLLGLPKEEEMIGSGISYCATCDGMFYKGKTVAVNGGGNAALEDVLFLSDYCEKVYLIHRRDTFRGERRMQKILEKKENVEFILNSTVSALLGEDRLSGIRVKENGGEEKELSVDGLFVAIGRDPATAIVKDLITLDERGYIQAGEDCHTERKGVFVAGDCRTKLIRQLTTAAADGAVAALAAVEYLDMEEI